MNGLVERRIHQTLSQAEAFSTHATTRWLEENPVECETWDVCDGDMDSYVETLGGVIGPESLKRRMGRRSLEIGDRPLVVVDLMASSAGVRSLGYTMRDEFGTRLDAISVSLTDDRGQERKAKDELLGVRHLVGDLGSSATWRKLRELLDGKKADYIVSVGVGGVSYIPRHEMYYAGALNRMWRMLNEDRGTMMIEVPSATTLTSVGSLPVETLDMILQNEGVCAVGKSIDWSSILYVERSPDNPEELVTA